MVLCNNDGDDKSNCQRTPKNSLLHELCGNRKAAYLAKATCWPKQGVKAARRAPHA